MSEWRSRFGGREWRLNAQGIQSRTGPGQPITQHRTRGEPATMRLYWEAWGDHLRAAYREHGVPPELMLAIVAAENGPGFRLPDGSPLVRPPREEPGYRSDDATPHRISVGPAHLLISTAREVMRDQSIDRAWLLDVSNNLRACAAFLARGHAITGWDPILCAARYNSGGLHDASSPASRWHNRWHLRSAGNHLDRIADWYGDATFVLSEAGSSEPETETAQVEVTLGGKVWRGEVRVVG